MKCSFSARELSRMILDAEVAYESHGHSALAQKMRLKAMRRFVEDAKRQSPNKQIQITLEDHLILTQRP